MQIAPGQRKRNGLFRAFQLMILCLTAQVTTVFGLDFNVPLVSLTNHNTSACSNYSYHFSSAVAKNFGPTSWVDTSGDTINIDSNKVDMSLNPITPGHVSHTDVHTLIPSRPDLRWFAHITPWFGSSSHINIGVSNNTAAYVAAMISDMENRGFNGVIIDWYGIGNQSDEVTKKIKSYLAGIPGNNFTYMICVDKGVASGLTTNNLVTQIHYCQTNYFNDANYETDHGAPILMFFGVRASDALSATDMSVVKAATDPNGLWVDEHTGHINESWVNMTFQWADTYDAGNTNALIANPYNLNAVTNDYPAIKSHSNMQAFGAMCAGFNGTLTKSIGWSLGKYLPGGGGLCEYYRAREINMVIPTNMTRMQWVTWSDWEEGTEVESGTENNFALTTRMNTTNVLSWTITSGDERTIDHYEVYASTDGVNAALLCSVPSGTHQTNLSQMDLPPGNYQFYVDAIGLPCIRDHLSTPAAQAQLPPPWLNQDIGSVSVGGSAAYTNGTFTVSGSGADIWGSHDSFQFVYQPWNGDGQIVARVASIQNTAPWAKAGLMFRETLDSGSAEGNVFITPTGATTNGVSMQNRVVANGSTSNVRTLSGISAPCWLSLIRLGNYLYSYESADGVNWTSVGTNVYSMTTNIYVGLCVSAVSNVLLNTSTFDHVAVGPSTVVGMPEPMINASNYTSNLKITFSGYTRSEALNDFPALVRLGADVPGFSYAQFASPAGGDLRFTDSGGAREIPFEIDQWNTNGESTIWVQVPSLSDTNTLIRAYWGNPADATLPDYTTNGAVWSSGYEAVYHLEQNGFPYFDSTLQYTSTNGIAPGLTNGLIGSCGYFTHLPYLDAGPVNLGVTFTVSAWINTALVSDENGICANGSGSYSMPGFKFFVNSYKTNDGTLNFLTGNGSAGAQVSTATNAVSVGQWHLVTAVVDHDGGSTRLYVDGDLQASGTIRNDFPTTNDVNIGQYPGGSFTFLGLMDETRIQSGLESSNWVWASWMTVAQNASFESYSTVDTSYRILNIQKSGNNIILTWPEGTLQSADQVAGPYNDVWSATSPYTNTVSDIQQFYRVKVQ